MSRKPQVLFVSHGGGPLPLLGDPGHREMVDCLNAIAQELRRPRAVLVISAHWEAPHPTLTAAEQPGLLYDYTGFAPEAYRIRYPCPGDAALAGRIASALGKAQIAAGLDAERGLDHGAFVPLKILFPEADIPCVQLSLIEGLDPAEHLALGAALHGLREEELLVIGSGFSFHNMKAFFGASTAETRRMNHAFDDWLLETILSEDLTNAEREARLLEWNQAPYATYCHPRSEHLLPLHVCVGLTQRACSKAYSLEILGQQSSMFLWS